MQIRKRHRPCRKEWLPSPVFLPGESHGQRSLACYSLWGHKEPDTTEWLTLSQALKVPLKPRIWSIECELTFSFLNQVACAWTNHTIFLKIFYSINQLIIIIFFLLHLAFIAVHGLPLVMAHRLWSAGSVLIAHQFCCSMACGIFQDQGLNLSPLHWQADS